MNLSLKFGAIQVSPLTEARERIAMAGRTGSDQVFRGCVGLLKFC
jgi:hypothetical protein